MAFFTSRYNVKPVVRGIAFVVMVILCLCGAVVAQQSVDPGQFSGSDSMSHSTFSLNSFGMGGFVFFMALKTPCLTSLALVISSLSSYTIFALLVKFLDGLTFFALAVLPLAVAIAYSTTKPKTIFPIIVFVKFRECFNFVAFGACFMYSLFSHFRLLIRRFWSEPYARPVRVSGSLYCIDSETHVNYFFENSKGD